MLVALILLAQFNLNIHDENLFDVSWLRLSKVEENFLLCLGKENTLLLCSPTGEVLAKFDQKGPGPTELDAPKIMGVSQNRIFIANKTRILPLDYRLNVIDERYPKLPFSIYGGVYLGSSQFLVHTEFRLHQAHIWSIEKNQTSCQEKGKWCPTFKNLDGKTIPHPSKKFNGMLSNGIFFYGKHKLTDDQVDISGFGYDEKQGQLSQVHFFTQDVSRYKRTTDTWGNRDRGYWTLAGTDGTHFYIKTTTFTGDRKKRESATSWHHILSRTGELQSRFTFSSAYPIFSFNSPDVFLINPEKGTVTKVTLEELDDAASRQVTQ